MLKKYIACALMTQNTDLLRYKNIFYVQLLRYLISLDKTLLTTAQLELYSNETRISMQPYITTDWTEKSDAVKTLV